MLPNSPKDETRGGPLSRNLDGLESIWPREVESFQVLRSRNVSTINGCRIDSPEIEFSLSFSMLCPWILVRTRGHGSLRLIP